MFFNDKKIHLLKLITWEVVIIILSAVGSSTIDISHWIQLHFAPVTHNELVFLSSILYNRGSLIMMQRQDD